MTHGNQTENQDALNALEAETDEIAARHLELQIAIRLLRAKLNAERWENYYKSTYRKG